MRNPEKSELNPKEEESSSITAVEQIQKAKFI